ncbi:Zinc finger domain-containing protein [Histomonas meleagridis]|uniref:Zinc finger domain-containing protein n=1 Tax=Histomonas meleagridis TaxID=135588 RepID=UPI00355A4BC0|nr:Zinc finger domain-containing protein [Histomonas meleagridis]KAH0798098.1 Zinc finger domain-containing protein [Histomonas meleagridis]
MGCSLCIPYQGPIWHSYYGPIQRPEAINAINAAINEQFRQEVGEVPTIPIRKVATSHISVPAALSPDPVSFNDDSTITVSFSSSCEGIITLQTENSSESHHYDASTDHTQIFDKPNEDNFTIKFDFDSWHGVTCRIYTLQSTPHSTPSVKNDKIVINGVISTISKVYKQEGIDGDDASSEGLCIICCSQRATVIAFPCRHCCMCKECSVRFSTLSSHCPVCRANVTELIEFSDEEQV